MKTETTKLPHVERLNEYLEGTLDSLRAPFADRPLFAELLVHGSRYFVKALEAFAGETLYVKRSSSPLERIPRRFHSLITRLIREQIIVKFSYPEVIPRWPRVAALAFRMASGRHASGYGLDYETATVRAVAELLERYSLAVYNLDSFIVGTYRELKSHGAIDPIRFLRFSELQLNAPSYASHRISEISKFAWVPCTSLLTGERHLVPAQLVYLGYPYLPAEPHIQQTTTSGTAAGTSWEMAAYYALCEVVERDAFMVHWLNRITPPRMNLNRCQNEELRRLLQEYQRYDIDVTVLDITTDIEVPVVAVVVRNHMPGKPVVCISTRAGLDVETALRFSLIDSLRFGTWLSVRSPNDAQRTSNETVHAIESNQERRRYWSEQSRLRELDFLFAGQIREWRYNENRRADIKMELSRLKEIFRQHQLDAYLIGITTPIAREAGLTVVRVVTPGLYPLYLGEYSKYLGSKRLYDAPMRMGALTRQKREEELNPVPHPWL